MQCVPIHEERRGGICFSCVGYSEFADGGGEGFASAVWAVVNLPVGGICFSCVGCSEFASGGGGVGIVLEASSYRRIVVHTYMHKPNTIIKNAIHARVPECNYFATQLQSYDMYTCRFLPPRPWGAVRGFQVLDNLLVLDVYQGTGEGVNDSLPCGVWC